MAGVTMNSDTPKPFTKFSLQSKFALMSLTSWPDLRPGYSPSPDHLQPSGGGSAVAAGVASAARNASAGAAAAVSYTHLTLPTNREV